MRRFYFSSTIITAGIFILLIGGFLITFSIFGKFLPNGFYSIDPFLFIGSVLATIATTLAAIQTAGEKWYIHASWLIFAFGTFFDVLVVVIEGLFQSQIGGTLTSVLMMASYSLYAIGIALLPSVPRPENLRKELNTVMGVFVGVSLLATWVLLIFPYVFRGVASNQQAFVALSYLMVFAVLDMLIRRRLWSNHRISFFLALSVAANVLGSFLVIVEQSGTTWWAMVLKDICWVAAYGGMALAGFSVAFEKDVSPDSIHVNREKENNPNLEFFLPVIWVGLAYLLLIWSHYYSDVISFHVVAVGIGSLIVVLLVRLNNVLRENARLISEANHEIASRRKMQEKFWHDSRHDPLTAIPNRSYLLDQIQNAIDTAKQTGKVSSAILFLDLDRFKPINDKYGHDIGDHLLKAISERLIFCVRPDDFVARLGGDEFAILLNNLQTSQTVYKICSRIMDKMYEPFEIQGNTLNCGVSFGVCFIEPDFNSPEALLSEADKAMYRAKRKGRGRFEISKAFDF
ncbi:MAG: GGDEF domain-containing protein [Leptolinea sp.]|nr:GGDEF domain-containing protein [Leptolinea sp.]